MREGSIVVSYVPPQTCDVEPEVYTATPGSPECRGDGIHTTVVILLTKITRHHDSEANSENKDTPCEHVEIKECLRVDETAVTNTYLIGLLR